jgi:hypothetical protein
MDSEKESQDKGPEKLGDEDCQEHEIFPAELFLFLESLLFS